MDSCSTSVKPLEFSERLKYSPLTIPRSVVEIEWKGICYCNRTTCLNSHHRGYGSKRRTKNLTMAYRTCKSAMQVEMFLFKRGYNNPKTQTEARGDTRHLLFGERGVNVFLFPPRIARTIIKLFVTANVINSGVASSIGTERRSWRWEASGE